MEDNQKDGFTAEGRRLRPRRPRISKNETGETHSSEKVELNAEESDYKPREFRGNYDRNSNYSHRGGYSGRSQSSYGHRDNGNGRSDSGDYSRGGYGNRGGYSHSGYGNNNHGGYNRGGYSGGNRNNYGNRPQRSYGQQRQYGDNQEDQRNPLTRQIAGRFRSAENGSDENRPQRQGGYRKEGGYSRQRPSYGNNRGGYRNGRGGGYSKPGFNKGPKKVGFAKNTRKQNPYTFNDSDEEGIAKMLSNKPLLDQIQLSDDDTAPVEIPDSVRLNKFIANSGVCSRREADQFIQAGVVSVNGEVVTELGTKINPVKDVVKFNDQTLRGEPKTYIVMNKPTGYVTTACDPHAEKTVMDLLTDCKTRVFPVGRLDKNTTGVLMFTNDGEIAEKLTHPAYEKKKIYQAILDKPLAEEDRDKILAGITLNDGDIKADELQYIDPDDKKKVGIEIHSGRNRIVRRIFESLGYEVKALDRVYFAGLTKKGLKKGEWRYLSESEANILRMGAYL
jgi:23S rRNA pseudouridine2605 synthase